jgi:hypothetical protein
MPVTKQLTLQSLSIPQLKTLHALISARIKFYHNHTDEQIKVSINAGLINSYIDFRTISHADFLYRQQVLKELKERPEHANCPEFWQDPEFF